MYAFVRVPLILWPKPLPLIFPAYLLHPFSNSLFLLFMLHTCSGYLGCGLHYGRNGSPQNPFSGKGLYPWAARSCVCLLLWNGTWHTSFCPLFRWFLGQLTSHPAVSCCFSDTSSCSHAPVFISRCKKITQLIHLSSATVAPNFSQELGSHYTFSCSQK